MPRRRGEGPANPEAERSRRRRAKAAAEGLRTDGKPRAADRGPVDPWKPLASTRALIRTLAGYECTFELMVQQLRLLQESGEVPKTRRINRAFVERNFKEELETGKDTLVMQVANSMRKQAIGYQKDQIVRLQDPETKKWYQTVAKVDVPPDFRAAEYLLMVKGGAGWQPPAKAGAAAAKALAIPPEKLPPIPEKITVDFVESPRKDEVS